MAGKISRLLNFNTKAIKERKFQVRCGIAKFIREKNSISCVTFTWLLTIHFYDDVMKMMLGSLTIFRYLYNNNFSHAKQSHFDFSISSIEWGSLNATQRKKSSIIKQYLSKQSNNIKQRYKFTSYSFLPILH